MRIREQANHKGLRGFFNTCPFLLILLSNFPFSAPLKSQRNINSFQNLTEIHAKPPTPNQNRASKSLNFLQVFSILTAYFVQNCLLILPCFSKIKNKAPVLKRVLRISVFFENFDFNFLKSFFNFLMNFCFYSKF